MEFWRACATLVVVLHLQPAPARGAECGPYRVAFYEFGTMYFRDSTGHEGGIDRDVLDEVQRRTGCLFKTSVVSRMATWAYMNEARADITMSSIRTSSRERQAAFAIYMKGDMTLFVRAELAGTIDSLHTFVTRGSWTLAVVKGFSYGPQLDALVADLRTQRRVADYSDADAVARVIRQGRADAFLGSPLAWFRILQAQNTQASVHAIPVASMPVIEAGIALSSQRVLPPDIARINRAVAAMKADGSLASIFVKHSDAQVARHALP